MNHLTLNLTALTIILSTALIGCGQENSQTSSDGSEIGFSKNSDDGFGLSIPNAYGLASEGAQANLEGGDILDSETSTKVNTANASDLIDVQCRQTREEAGLSNDKIDLFVRLHITNPRNNKTTYENLHTTMKCFGDLSIFLKNMRHDRTYQVVAGLGLEGRTYSYIGVTPKFSLQVNRVAMNMQRFWGNTIEIDMYFPVSAEPAGEQLEDNDGTERVRESVGEKQKVDPIDPTNHYEGGGEDDPAPN